MKNICIFCTIFCSLLLPIHAKDFSIPKDCKQIILGIAKDAHTSSITLQRWVLTSEGWYPYENLWHGRVGREGLAWGRGIHPDLTKQYPDIPAKTEGDWRSPCGVFEIGPAYGQTLTFPENVRIPYYPVNDRDLWIEDSTSAYYNQHIRVDKGELNEWQKKQRMKVDDPAHKYQLLIRHNYLPHIKLGAGSSIFFHIWRDNGKIPTSGCTTLSEPNLIALISWLDPEKHPLFILLPESIYKDVKDSWGLP